MGPAKQYGTVHGKQYGQRIRQGQQGETGMQLKKTWPGTQVEPAEEMQQAEPNTAAAEQNTAGKTLAGAVVCGLGRYGTRCMRRLHPGRGAAACCSQNNSGLLCQMGGGTAPEAQVYFWTRVAAGGCGFGLVPREGMGWSSRGGSGNSCTYAQGAWLYATFRRGLRWVVRFRCQVCLLTFIPLEWDPTGCFAVIVIGLWFLLWFVLVVLCLY